MFHGHNYLSCLSPPSDPCLYFFPHPRPPTSILPQPPTPIPTPLPPFSPSLISLMVSVDVKHHVCLLTYLLTSRPPDADEPSDGHLLRAQLPDHQLRRGAHGRLVTRHRDAGPLRGDDVRPGRRRQLVGEQDVHGSDGGHGRQRVVAVGPAAPGRRRARGRARVHHAGRPEPQHHLLRARAAAGQAGHGRDHGEPPARARRQRHAGWLHRGQDLRAR